MEDPSYFTFKNYIEGLRRVELREMYVMINENLSPKLYFYVDALLKLKFSDGAYNRYCGDIKILVGRFITYWMDIMDDCRREVDRYSNDLSKEGLLDLIQVTILAHQHKQIAFARAYLPVESDEERAAYDEIEKLHSISMSTIYELEDDIKKIDKKECLEEFNKVHFTKAIQRKNDLFEYTHTFISKSLACHISRVRLSVEDILFRLRRNLQVLQEQREAKMNVFMHELYDKNKEHLMLNRAAKRNSVDIAEVAHGIDIIRKKIEDFETNVSMPRLIEEVSHWEGRHEELLKIENTIKKLKAEKNHVLKEKHIYDSLRTTELPGYKRTCFENIGKKINETLEFLDSKLLDASKALLSFFGIRGVNRILYKDHIGRYTMDDYGHQVYYFDHGIRVYHLNCKGEYVTVVDRDKYYYDYYGRYVINKDKEKLYQCAECTSLYKLDVDNLMKKVTKDCGHSEKVNPNCKMSLKDPHDVELLPQTEIIQLQKCLKPEVTQYIWDSLCHLLPESLKDVGNLEPKNPIHILGHILLANKYRRTTEEVQQCRKDAKAYRDDIFKKRIDKALAANKAWKAKQLNTRNIHCDDVTTAATYEGMASQEYYTAAYYCDH